jgi:hypothetical protein
VLLAGRPPCRRRRHQASQLTAHSSHSSQLIIQDVLRPVQPAVPRGRDVKPRPATDHRRVHGQPRLAAVAAVLAKLQLLSRCRVMLAPCTE